MSDGKPLIERMKECWRDYQAMPDTKDRQFGRLNLVAFMGERMGKVLDYITELESQLADSQPSAQPSTANWQDTVISMTAYEFNKQMQDAYGVGYDMGKFGRSTEVTLDDLLYHEDDLPTQPQEDRQ